MGHITMGIAEGEGTYNLKVQKKCDGSDCKWHSKGRNDVQPEDTEEVRWVRSQMAQ